MSEEQKIRFAVVGTGHIGLRHAELIRRNPDCELVALCDILPEEETRAGDYGVPYFGSIEALLAGGPPCDVVSICTPNGLHAQQALLALDHRKHVVVEKPMALTKSDCEKIIHKALQAHKIVFCVMQNRYSPPSVWLKDVMSSNLLGDIFMVQLVCYWNRDDRYYTRGSWKGTANLDGGTLFTQFSHWVDLMYWLFGDITDIQARFGDFTHQKSTSFEDSGFVTFRFLNGGIGNLAYSTAVYDRNLESSMTVIGRNGSIKVGGQYMDKVEYCHIRDYAMPELPASNPPNDYGIYKGSAANHQFIIQNVVDTLRSRTHITTNAMEGLKVVDIIERIYALRTVTKKAIVATV